MVNHQKNTKNLTPWDKIWRLALAIALPLGGGFIISLFTRDAMAKFSTFNQPPLSPPGWIFPVAWSILYVLMGIASYLIWKKYHESKDKIVKAQAKSALTAYAIQLFFNFVWTPLFFILDWFWPAFVWLMVMWVLIIVLMVKTYKLSRPAFWMLVPYILWCTFAAYLDCGIAILN